MVNGRLFPTSSETPSARLKEAISQAGAFLLDCFPEIPSARCFLQFGPGFEATALFDEAPKTVELSQLPGMPAVPTPDQVQPKLNFGTSGGVPVFVCQGHRHLSEGLGLFPCILPLMVAWHLGIRKHFFIDSGISLIPDVKAGNWTLLTDFMNGHGFSPLDGLHELLENPFPDLAYALSQELNSEIVNALDQIGIGFKLCTYQAIPGFHFCTGAEAGLARNSGAEILGHDLVMEIILSHALGCKASAAVLACGQNLNTGQPALKRKEVLDTCQFCSGEFLRGLMMALPEISQIDLPQPPIQLPEANADEILQKSITLKTGKKFPFKLLRKES